MDMDLLAKQAYVLENLQLLPAEKLKDYQESFAITLAKNSSTIEGESITLAQVIQIVKGININGDSNLNRRVFNHYQAYQMVVERALKKEPLTDDFLKDVHEVLLDGIASGGLYRRVNIKVNGSNYIPCDYVKLYDRMGKFFYDLENFQGSPVELAAYTHLQIAKIHPFLDGNGRLARLMMNYQLISHDLLPVSISVKNKNEYFATLEEFKVNKNDRPFIEMLENLLNKEYDRLIALIDESK